MISHLGITETTFRSLYVRSWLGSLTKAEFRCLLLTLSDVTCGSTTWLPDSNVVQANNAAKKTLLSLHS